MRHRWYPLKIGAIFCDELHIRGKIIHCWKIVDTIKHSIVQVRLYIGSAVRINTRGHVILDWGRLDKEGRIWAERRERGRMSLSQIGAGIRFCRTMWTKSQRWKRDVVQRVGSKRGWPQYEVQIRTWKEGSPHGRLDLGYRGCFARLVSLVGLHITSLMESLNFNTGKDLISLLGVLTEFPPWASWEDKNYWTGSSQTSWSGLFWLFKNIEDPQMLQFIGVCIYVYCIWN